MVVVNGVIYSSFCPNCMGTGSVGTQIAENKIVVRHELKTTFFRSLLDFAQQAEYGVA
jgi:hypothetical protein